MKNFSSLPAAIRGHARHQGMLRQSVKTAIFIIAISSVFARAEGLFDSYSRALRADPDYAAARAIYDGDIRSRDLAAQAFLPSVNLSATRETDTYKRRDLSSPVELNRTYEPTVLGLRLTQPLFSKDRSGYKRENEIRAERAEWALAQARQDLALRVVQTTFNYLLTLDQITLAQAQAEAVQAQLTQLNALLDSRSSTRTEVADARARFELARVQVKTAQSQLEVRKLEYLRITGEMPMPGLRPLNANPHLQNPEPFDPQPWIDAARERSFKVLMQRATVQLADVGIERIKAGFYPSVSLIAGIQQANKPNYFTGTERTNTVSVQMNMSLFDGFNTLTQTSQAVSQAERARFELQAAQHEVATGTGQAYWGVVNGMEQIKATEQAVAAADLALEGTRLGIKANVKTYTDELNAVQLLYGARRDLQKERYSYLMNRAQLQWSAGLSEDVLTQLFVELSK